jgi:hypothetical protein
LDTRTGGVRHLVVWRLCDCLERGLGGYAVAQDFAVGGIARALQANNDIAARFMKASAFFRISGMTLPYLFWLNLAWVIPLVIQWRVIAHKRTRKPAN